MNIHTPIVVSGNIIPMVHFGKIVICQYETRLLLL